MKGFNTLAGLVLVATILAFALMPVSAATTTSARGNAVHMSATGDSAGKTNCVIRSVKVMPRATGKIYKLCEGATTGPIVWESGSYASSLENPKAEVTNIQVGSLDTFFVTDDSTASITLGY